MINEKLKFNEENSIINENLNFNKENNLLNENMKFNTENIISNEDSNINIEHYLKINSDLIFNKNKEVKKVTKTENNLPKFINNIKNEEDKINKDTFNLE